MTDRADRSCYAGRRGDAFETGSGYALGCRLEAPQAVTAISIAPTGLRT